MFALADSMSHLRSLWHLLIECHEHIGHTRHKQASDSSAGMTGAYWDLLLVQRSRAAGSQTTELRHIRQKGSQS